MQQDVLLGILARSRANCLHTFKDITDTNINLRLNEKTASIGFIYRHIGEATTMLCQFFGIENNAPGQTMGKEDTGENFDLETSRRLVEEGYDSLEKIIKSTDDADWLTNIDTTFFGTISKIDLFSITVFHNSHHCGQIASALVKGS